MFWIVCSLLCFFYLYLLRTAEVYEKTRKAEFEYWGKKEWVKLDHHLMLPRYVLIIYCLLSLMPILNLFLAVGMTIVFIRNARDPKGNDGYSLVLYRLRPKGSKLLNWLGKRV